MAWFLDFPAKVSISYLAGMSESQKKRPLVNKRQLIFLIVVLVLYLFSRFGPQLSNQRQTRTDAEYGDIVSALSQRPLTLTAHGSCRMQCREISLEEITEVLHQGKLNLEKSDENDLPCPSYVMEDRTADGQLVRVVFALCETETRVVTVIDLENSYNCDCD